MFDQHSPVGILDSGIGGFSVVRQVQRLLPGEDLLYFGDGATSPMATTGRRPSWRWPDICSGLWRSGG